MATTAFWILAGVAVAGLAGLVLLWRMRWSRMSSDLHARADALDERDTRLTLRESTLETKARTLELREANLLERDRALTAAQAALDDERVALRKRLEETADYTADEARQALLAQVEAQVREDARALHREEEKRAREEAAARARAVVATAVQRLAVDTTAGVVTSTLPLPEEEYKGRIIGRDGRNVRAFQHLTGVDVLVDDTPGAVVLSSFDPVRRETAKRTLESLIDQGRFHPGAIEAAYEVARQEIDVAIDRAGGDAVEEAQVAHVDPDVVRLLGQLEYRTSYGQNVRLHSIETALLAGGMAEELGADAALARRCGLLHDIGKALSHELKGSHAAVGAEVARRLGEPEPVCHAIAAHHGEVEPQTVEAVLTQAADAVSAGRPGARRNSLEQHCLRLRRIEELCAEFTGVRQVFAMQAGRDVRVMVHPDDVDDAGVGDLSRRVAERIEEEIPVPGQVTVTVIREVRAHWVAS